MTGSTSAWRACLRKGRWFISLALALLVAAIVAGPASASWWHLPAKPTWYWQLGGTVNNSHEVEIYDIDGFNNSAEEVSTLHSLGRHVVCYIDVGGAEEYRPDYYKFVELEKEGIKIMGNKIEGWPEERWINIRELKYVEPIMKARFEMCKEKGFDAVEPDEIEAWSEKTGLKITAAEQLTYDKWVAETVHSLGMAVLQKNDGAQTPEQQPYFDGALTEECNVWKECGEFKPYIEAGKPVLNAEYTAKKSEFCAKDEEAGFMGARYNLELNGELFEPCW